MPAQANGLVQAAAQSPQSRRDDPNESEAMRSFVVNANERHWCGDDILHRFGPPALGLSTFRRTGSQAGGCRRPRLTSGCHVVAKGGKQSFDPQIDADLRRDGRNGWQPLRQHS
ncbi:MAG TPA: hypothetical protein VGM98_12455, partial [Schlesneria sp.]